MAVLVKPNGLFGTGYMAAIRPFRHLIVYPPMLHEIGRGWQALPSDPAPAHASLRWSIRNPGSGIRHHGTVQGRRYRP
jgi:hypothetical protein